MKHTPGPWKYMHPFIATEHNTVIGKAQDTKDGPLNWQCSGPADLENIANGKLLAAAPELLEACKYVVKYHREHDSGEGELFGLDFVTTCINAIRKAERENA